MIRINHPNAGFSFFPSIFFDNCEPIIIPATAIAVIEINSFHSIFTWFTEDTKPIKELKEIMTKEVPIAIFIGIFKRLTNAGMIIKPPPAPTNPLMKPIIPPKITKTVGLFFLVEGCSF